MDHHAIASRTVLGILLTCLHCFWPFLHGKVRDMPIVEGIGYDTHPAGALHPELALRLV